MTDGPASLPGADASGEALAAALAYERLHVPALFREWAPRLLDAAGVGDGDRVLDVACGTGVCAREAVARVGASGAVVGVDADAGMVAAAAGLAPEVELHRAPAEALPLPADEFTAVVCQFGLQFFANRAEALREMLRVLRPGGRVAVAVWDSVERSPPYSAIVDLLEDAAGPLAAEALRAPFVLGNRDEVAAMLESAGFAGVGAVTVEGTGRFPSVRDMVEADLRGWLPVVGVTLDEPTIRDILGRAESALAGFVTPDGEVVFPTSAHIVTGRKA